MNSLICWLWDHSWVTRYSSNVPSLGNAIDGWNYSLRVAIKVCRRCGKRDDVHQ